MNYQLPNTQGLDAQPFGPFLYCPHCRTTFADRMSYMSHYERDTNKCIPYYMLLMKRFSVEYRRFDGLPAPVPVYKWFR